MKKILLTLGLMAGFAMANAQILSPSPQGIITRSELYLSVDESMGAGDAFAAAQETNAELEACRALLLRAEALFLQGFTREAATAFGTYAQNYPYAAAVPHARLRLAQCLTVQGKYNCALEILSGIDEATLSHNDAATALLTKGVCLLFTGNKTAALASFNAINPASPISANARYYLAYMAFGDGDYARAIDLFRNNPIADSDCYIAASEYMQGQWSRALSSARRLLERGNLSADWHNELTRIAGESLFAMGQQSQGAEYLRNYIAACPQALPGAKLLVGIYDYSNGEISSAEPLLRQAADSPGAIGQMANLYLGQALYRQGRMDVAILAFENASHTEGREDARQAAYFNYIAAKFAGAQAPFSSSADVFEDFLNTYPSSPYSDRVRQYLAEGYLADNDMEKALARLEAIRNPGPAVQAGKQYILYVTGTEALNSGDVARANILLNRAAAIEGNAGIGNELTLSRARAADASGEHNDAVRLYREYLRTASREATNRPFANYGLGYALYANRNYDSADEAFAAAENAGTFGGRILADILNRRADIASYNGNFGAARDLYVRARQADASSGDYSLLQTARMEGYLRNYTDKLTYVDEFTGTYPQSALMPDALLERTQALISLNRKPEAIETYRRIIAQYPLTAQGRQGYLQMALTLLDMNRRQEAMEAYRDVISNYPTSEEARQASSLLRRLYAEDGRGNEYLAFMESVDGAPGVDREDAAELSYSSARHAYSERSDTTQLAQFLVNYPDAPQAENALILLAGAEFQAGLVPQALARYRELEQRASTPQNLRAARLGIMRASREAGDNALAGEMARLVLADADIEASALGEASYVLGLSLAEDNNLAEAVEVWNTVATRTAEQYGAMSAFYAADALFTLGRTDEALAAAQALSSSRSPQQYWVARAFILQSDIFNAQGRTYEAREYLRALSENYPGTEPDIQDMIQTRLQNLQ